MRIIAHTGSLRFCRRSCPLSPISVKDTPDATANKTGGGDSGWLNFNKERVRCTLRHEDVDRVPIDYLANPGSDRRLSGLHRTPGHWRPARCRTSLTTAAWFVRSWCPEATTAFRPPRTF